MSIINQKSDITWTPYLATGIAEGFEESDHPYAVIEAWAYLIKSGQAWQLQGWFGRNAKAIIDSGVINSNGDINWDMVAEAEGN